MRRELQTPRSNWPQRVEELGFTFHTLDDKPYWDESVAYVFTEFDFNVIQKATQDLYDMCIWAAEQIIEDGNFRDLAIPKEMIPMIQDSWEKETPSLYGRFDLAWDGTGNPKLLEYNAQTPTSLLEAAEIQWQWRTDVKPKNDQFTSIQPMLVEQWRQCAPFLNGTVHFTYTNTEEDSVTAQYMSSLAQAAGVKTQIITIDDIGWDHNRRIYVDLEENPIRNIFALYPWEWLIREQADNMAESWASTVWIEPPWKLILSNKAILAYLWKMFPNHPNLLECYTDGPRGMAEYVRKPFFSREGANIAMVNGAGTLVTDGPYGGEGQVYQKMTNLFNQDNKYAVIGSWYVTDQGPAGIGMRESDGPITGNLSRFVPHYIE